MWGKDDGDYDYPTSQDETSDENKEAKKMREVPTKNERKERRGSVTILLPQLCFRVAQCSSYRESPELSLYILVGIFIREHGLYINDGLPQNALGLREQASWMHTHLVSFVELSYTYSSSGSVAWQSLLLTLTSIDGHLHSPLISRVDVRLSPFLSSPHNPHHYILFHP